MQLCLREGILVVSDLGSIEAEAREVPEVLTTVGWPWDDWAASRPCSLVLDIIIPVGIVGAETPSYFRSTNQSERYRYRTGTDPCCDFTVACIPADLLTAVPLLSIHMVSLRTSHRYRKRLW